MNTIGDTAERREPTMIGNFMTTVFIGAIATIASLAAKKRAAKYTARRSAEDMERERRGREERIACLYHRLFFIYALLFPVYLTLFSLYVLLFWLAHRAEIVAHFPL